MSNAEAISYWGEQGLDDDQYIAYDVEQADERTPVQPRKWSVFEGGEFAEPTSLRISQVNTYPLKSLRAAEAVAYAFELAGVIQPRGELSYRAGKLAKEPEVEDGEHPAFSERRDETKEQVFSEEEATYNDVYGKVVEALNHVAEFSLSDREELRERTKNYTPRKVPILKELKAMSEPHKHKRTGEMTTDVIEENAAWLAADTVRLMIDNEVHRQQNQA